MEPLSLLPAIAALLVAMAVTRIVARHVTDAASQGRFSSIDGLRGYLAFLVFLHHSSIWFSYLRTNQWEAPKSNTYAHFGQSSVALFFMITGFLFSSKIMAERRTGIDWDRLFISRFLRLTPLYIFAMLLLFSIIACISNGKLNEPFPEVVGSAARWLAFTIPGSPNINGIDETFIIVAGVTWSLPYEWFFYFSLPLLATSVRSRVPFAYFAVGVMSLAGFVFWQSTPVLMLPFISGIATSILVRSQLFLRIAATRAASLLVVAFLVFEVVMFQSAYELLPMLFLSMAFALIAGGNSVFGILTNHVSRAMGELSYGIYLVHGILLFTVFNLVIGTSSAKNLSPTDPWLVLIAAPPPLILGCFLPTKFIERPAMRKTNAVTAWFRSATTQ